MNLDLLARVAAHGMGLHSKLAAAIGPVRLVCRVCKSEQRPGREDVSRYFRDGWPECCGTTMAMEKLEVKSS
jgi:hypothetical protein